MKGFIFDLDGTLLDSLGMWLKIDKDYMARYGIEYKREYSDVIKTLTYDQCAYYFRDELGIDRSIELIKQDWREMSKHEYAHNLELKPYAREFVMQCVKEGRCIIATSCQKEQVIACLKRLDLIDYFVDIITTHDVGKSKEHPDIYLRSAEKLGLLVEDCVVFEDVLEAATCAYNAGFEVVGVYDPMWQKDEEAMRKVSSRYICSFEECLK